MKGMIDIMSYIDYRDSL